MINSIVIGFVLLGVDATLSDLITLTQFQRCEISRGLFQDFMDEYIKP